MYYYGTEKCPLQRGRPFLSSTVAANWNQYVLEVLLSQFISSGRLKHFPNVHGGLGAVYQSPCVVFTGHPSLRCGDAVHFMEAWGNSAKNAIIFTEPDFDHLHALAPYQPLSMKVGGDNGWAWLLLPSV